MHLYMMSYLCRIIIILLGIRSSSTGNSTDSRTPITLLVLGPYPDSSSDHNPDWTGGPALIPAVRLAVDRINNERSDLLPGYLLRLLEGDSGCNLLSKTATSFPQLFHTNPEENGNVVGIIGPGCSEAATLVADIGAKQGVSLIQMGIATSPVLTNTTRFSNTFRMLTSSIEFVNLFVRLIKHNRDRNGWKDFAALYDGQRQYFVSTFRAFVDINDSDINIGFSSSIFDSYFPLKEIELKYKVIFVFAGSTLASKLMCLAYHFDPPLLYPVYQWIFHDRTEKQFIKDLNFVYKGVNYYCSAEQMKEALQGVILNRHSLHREDKAPLVDLSPEEFSELYEQYLDNHTSQLPNSSLFYSRNGRDYANAYYDGTWAFALGLNATLGELGPQSLLNYSYGNPITTSVIKSRLKEVSFEGLLGRVSFHDESQDSYIPLNVFQFLGASEMLFGNYSNDSLLLNEMDIQFVAGGFLEKGISVHPAASFIFVFLTLLILVFVATLHAVYIICSHERSIKASSPKFSHLIFSGCYLLILLSAFITAFTSDLVGNDPKSREQTIIAGVICNIVYWELFIGLSLIMSSLCVQLWRIYRIFNHISNRDIFLSDMTLTLCILFLVSVNVVILTLWTLVDPLLINYHHESVQKSKDPRDDPVILIRAHCSCKYFNIWLAVLFSINVLVALCVVVLSSLNRGISYSYFKTTKSVNVMVYLINILLILCIGLGFILERLNVHYMYVLWEVSFLGVVFVVSTFFFLPPTLPVFRGLIAYSQICFTLGFTNPVKPPTIL